MWVTAYTDASFSSKGGWAVWLRSERGRVVKAGECPSSVKDSMAAELYAIVRAVELAVGEWKSTSGLLINTDCAGLINRLHPWSDKFTRADLAELQQKFVLLIADHALRVRVKHVKGHQSGQGVRSYLNTQVDRLSRRARKK